MSVFFTEILRVPTRGRGFYEITDALERALQSRGADEGLLTVFCRHTSASLIITENADPSVREDLARLFDRLVPENENYAHTLEGSDDAVSHLRAVLTRTSESIPFTRGRLCLGTWQGVFLWEHRRAPHVREIVASFGANAAR